MGHPGLDLTHASTDSDVLKWICRSVPVLPIKYHRSVIMALITHLVEGAMTLQTQHTANAPATLSDEQRRRVSDALENAQSVNTRRNYAGKLRKFRDWSEHEGQSALPASPEVVAAYAAELVDDGKICRTGSNYLWLSRQH